MRRLLLSACGVAPMLAFAQPTVVTSIHPVSMIVSAVGGDNVRIEQLVNNNASPHDFALRPSDIRNLGKADLVVWTGEALENFMLKPLSNLSNVHQLEWMELPGVALQEFGDDHDHDHGDHDHGDHDHKEHHDGHDHEEHHDGHDHEEHRDGHDHEEHHDGHDHEEHRDEHDHEEHHDEHGHEEHGEADGHEGHDHTGTDPHIWLDPFNAQVLAQAVAQELSEIDPANAGEYQENLRVFLDNLAQTEADIRADFTDVKDVPYVVFHDAYGYFEGHYGLNNAGAITVSPERKPGAQTVAKIREQIHEHQVQCVFSEPQFKPAIVETLIEGTDVRTAVLDPLGSNIAVGPNSYNEFIRALAGQFTGCLR